jgi:hypothetical protein
MVSAGTRKQVYELTLSDLDAWPIWEFCLDEEDVDDQDEATVRPRFDVDAFDTREHAIGLAVVKTEFRAADGTAFAGYCTPSESDHLGYVQPTIIVDGEQVSFWFGWSQPSPGEIGLAYGLLGKQAKQLFPLQFRALVPTPRFVAQGTISGFSWLGRRLGRRQVRTTA